MIDFLRTNPVFTLFIILGGGYLLGRLRIGPVSLGPVAGALLVSLVFGQFGFKVSEGAQSVGFALFIFAVGYQAGPRFFEVLKTQGLQYLALALFVAGTGGAIAIAAGRLLDLPFGGTAGLLAGAMTTTPTLAAAQDAVRSGIVALPEGASADSVLATIASSYAITYIVGLLGIIATIRMLPRVVGVDLAAEAAKMEEAGKPQRGGQLQARAYRVTRPEACEPTVRMIRARFWDAMSVTKLLRNGEWVRLGDDEHLQLGDELHAYGDSSFFRGGVEELGEEIPVSPEIDMSADYTHVVIARRGAVGKTIAELDLARNHGLVVTEVRRDGVRLPLSSHLRLQRSDVLSVAGPKPGLREMQEVLGPVESGIAETDMATFAFGIALGALIGVFAINVGGVPIGLGMAGGLLGSGIFVGWFNAIRPDLRQVSRGRAVDTDGIRVDDLYRWRRLAGRWPDRRDFCKSGPGAGPGRDPGGRGTSPARLCLWSQGAAPASGAAAWCAHRCDDQRGRHGAGQSRGKERDTGAWLYRNLRLRQRDPHGRRHADHVRMRGCGN